MLLSGKGPNENWGEVTRYWVRPLTAMPSTVALSMLGSMKLAKNVAQLRRPFSLVSPRLSPFTVEHSEFMIGKKSALPNGIVHVLSACPRVMLGLFGSGLLVKVPPINHTDPDCPAVQ